MLSLNKCHKTTQTTRTTFLLVVNFLMWNGFSQNYSYDTAAANNCNTNRIIQINKQNVFVPKYAKFSIAKFIGFQGGWVTNRAFFKLATDSILVCQTWDTSMYFFNWPYTEGLTGKKAEFGKQYFTMDSSYFCFTNSPLQIDSTYQILYKTEYLDSAIEKFQCGPMYNFILVSFAKLGQPFSLSSTSGKCDCDSSMNGYFVDEKSGENLRIAEFGNSVYYASKKSKQLKELKTLFFEPGFVKVGFQKNNLIQEAYVLSFHNNKWHVLDSYDCEYRNCAHINFQTFKKKQ